MGISISHVGGGGGLLRFLQPLFFFRSPTGQPNLLSSRKERCSLPGSDENAVGAGY